MKDARFVSVLVRDGYFYDARDRNFERPIGVTAGVYNELQSEHKELTESYNAYQQKLIELGVISPPIEPEQEIVHIKNEIANTKHEMSEIKQMMAIMLERLEPKGERDGSTRRNKKGRFVKSDSEESIPDGGSSDKG